MRTVRFGLRIEDDERIPTPAKPARLAVADADEWAGDDQVKT